MTDVCEDVNSGKVYFEAKPAGSTYTRQESWESG